MKALWASWSPARKITLIVLFLVTLGMAVWRATIGAWPLWLLLVWFAVLAVNAVFNIRGWRELAPTRDERGHEVDDEAK